MMRWKVKFKSRPINTFRFHLEEVAMDFEVIGESQEGPDRVDVLLAASRTEVVDNVVASIELGGLTAKIVDIEAFAIENTIDLMSNDFPAGTSKDAIAVADVGSAVTTFSVMENMKIIYSREEVVWWRSVNRRYSTTIWFVI